MKKLLLILLCLPIIGFTQTTWTPCDSSFSISINSQDSTEVVYSVSGPNFNMNSNFSWVYFNMIGQCIGGSNSVASYIDTLNALNINNITDSTAIMCLISDSLSSCIVTDTLVYDSLTGWSMTSNQFLALQTYVPDDSFEQALINLGYDNILDDSVLTANINTIDSLTIGGLNISDLTGIEDFTYLSYLACWGNQLTTLNVTQNTILNHLWCDGNQLTTLDVTQNTDLNFLNCSLNSLTALDVSQNPLLTTLFCDINQITSLDLSNNQQLYYLVCQDNQLTSLDLRNGNNTNFSYCSANNNSNLFCINVDDPTYSYANWLLGNNFDPQQYFSNNCPMVNLNCSDSLLITDVIIDNTNLTMNIAIYNSYNSFLNYPHVAFTIDANGDTIQTGNINLFGAFNYDTTWYNYSISSPSLFPTYPLTCYFVYTSSLTFMSDTCILIYNSTPTTILYPSYNNEKEIIKITDLLGREKKQTNQPLFYIYDDGTVEKRIVIE